MKHKFCWPTLEAVLHKVLPPRSSVKSAQLLQPVLRSIAMDAGVVGALALGPRPSSRRRRSAASCIVEGDPCPSLSLVELHACTVPAKTSSAEALQSGSGRQQREERES